MGKTAAIMMSNTTTKEISQKIDLDFQEEDKGKTAAIMMSNTSENKMIMIKPRKLKVKTRTDEFPPPTFTEEEEQKQKAIAEARVALELAKKAEAESLAKLRAIEAAELRQACALQVEQGYAEIRAIDAEEDSEDEICKGCINNNGEAQYDGYCEECHAEQLGHHQLAPFKFRLCYEDSCPTERFVDLETAKIAMKAVIERGIYSWVQIRDIEADDDDEDDFVEEWVGKESDEDDEEKALLAQLAEVKLKKAQAKARENITELRDKLKDYQRKLIIETEIYLFNLKAQFDTIDEGAYDDELIDKKGIIPKQSTKQKGERRQPTYEGKGKKAGTGDCRAREIAMLNNGKNLNKLSYSKLYKGMTWYLYDGTRPNKGVQVYKDEEGKYDIPNLKDLDWIGFRRTKQQYIDWLKEN